MFGAFNVCRVIGADFFTSPTATAPYKTAYVKVPRQLQQPRVQRAGVDVDGLVTMSDSGCSVMIC